MLNTLLVQQRLLLISRYLSELERLSGIGKEDFLRDKDKTAATESYLRRSLEAVLDTGRHILAKTGPIDLAGEYKSIPVGLVQQGIIDGKLGQKLVQMAGYCNRLVHLYNEVSDEELYGIIVKDLADIRHFITQIRDYLARVG